MSPGSIRGNTGGPANEALLLNPNNNCFFQTIA